MHIVFHKKKTSKLLKTVQIPAQEAFYDLPSKF